MSILLFLNRRWIGSIIRSSNIHPTDNLHNHPVSPCLSHKLPSMVTSDISKTLQDNPYLTTQQLDSEQGLGYQPRSAEIAGTSYSRLDYHRKKSLRDGGVSSKGLLVVTWRR